MRRTSQQSQRGVRWPTRIAIAAVPGGIAAVLIWSGWEDLTQGFPGSILPWMVVGLLVGAAVWCLPSFELGSRGRRIRRVVEWFLQALLITMGILFVLIGLIAPGGLVTPGRPGLRTTSGVQITALIAVASFLAVGVTALLERRRSRRRGQAKRRERH